MTLRAAPLLFALVSSSLLLAACGHGVKQQAEAKPVIAERLAVTDTTARDSYSGDVHARYESVLSFREPGKIVTRYVNLGDSVKAGQLLAKLDTADAELNKDAAQAGLTAAESSYQTAKRELDRYAALVKTGVVSRSAFEHQQDLYTTAEANYQQARRAFELRGNQLAYTELRADHQGVVTAVDAEANYQQARRAFELRGNQLAYTELRADHQGVVTAVDAEAGQVVAEGQSVMSLAWSGDREVYIDVPENRIGEFSGAKDIGVTLWGTDGKRYKGSVRERSASADPATRTFLVKIAITRPGPEVKLGMTAAVDVADAVDPQELLIPMSALYHKDQATAVWVVDPKTSQLTLKPVQVQRYTDAGVVIGSGLTPGDTVVLKGVNELYEKETVQPALADVQAGRSL